MFGSAIFLPIPRRSLDPAETRQRSSGFDRKSRLTERKTPASRAPAFPLGEANEEISRNEQLKAIQLSGGKARDNKSSLSLGRICNRFLLRRNYLFTGSVMRTRWLIMKFRSRTRIAQGYLAIFEDDSPIDQRIFFHASFFSPFMYILFYFSSFLFPRI